MYVIGALILDHLCSTSFSLPSPTAPRHGGHPVLRESCLPGGSQGALRGLPAVKQLVATWETTIFCGKPPCLTGKPSFLMSKPLCFIGKSSFSKCLNCEWSCLIAVLNFHRRMGIRLSSYVGNITWGSVEIHIMTLNHTLWLVHIMENHQVE